MVLKGVLSDPRVVECGVPQGSILGPSLFLTYINDMADSCSCELFLYADDSAFLMYVMHVNELMHVLPGFEGLTNQLKGRLQTA